MTSSVVVLDASALIDLLLETPTADWVRSQLDGRSLAAPAHLPAEVFSALGRLHRAGLTRGEEVERYLERVRTLQLTVSPVAELFKDAWALRDRLGLADALYVALAANLDTIVVTTDRRLARATTLAVAPAD